jgi:hypothetical protein
MIVGVDFGAPRGARDQRRKSIAIAARDSPLSCPAGARGEREAERRSTLAAYPAINSPPRWSTASPGATGPGLLIIGATARDER